METETKYRNASVYVHGIKKRCRKPSKEYVEASAVNDTEALKLLKDKVREVIKGFREIEGYSVAICRDITFIDCGDYKIKQMNIFCDSETRYNFYV